MIGLYFAFGLGFYIGLAVKDPHGFVDASAAALIRGLLLGIVFWPIGLIVQVVFALLVPKKKKVSFTMIGPEDK